MNRWEVTCVRRVAFVLPPFTDDQEAKDEAALQALLDEGWEPFGVTADSGGASYLLHLRRFRQS